MPTAIPEVWWIGLILLLASFACICYYAFQLRCVAYLRGELEIIEHRASGLLGDRVFAWNSHIVRKYLRPNSLNLLLPSVGLLAPFAVVVFCVWEDVGYAENLGYLQVSGFLQFHLTVKFSAWLHDGRWPRLIFALIVVLFVVLVTIVAIASTVVNGRVTDVARGDGRANSWVPKIWLPFERLLEGWSVSDTGDRDRARSNGTLVLQQEG